MAISESEKSLADFREICRKCNLRVTPQRSIIYKEMLDSPEHLSAEVLYVRINKKFPDISLDTIYRTLESFCKAGLVHKAFISKRAVHFELANRCGPAQCHPHFTCKNCGATDCLVGLSVPIVQGLRKGFIIHRQQVRLEGLCPSCA